MFYDDYYGICAFKNENGEYMSIQIFYYALCHLIVSTLNISRRQKGIVETHIPIHTHSIHKRNTIAVVNKYPEQYVNNILILFIVWHRKWNLRIAYGENYVETYLLFIYLYRFFSTCTGIQTHIHFDADIFP